jgi:arylsulfatase A-like enzyme
VTTTTVPDVPKPNILYIVSDDQRADMCLKYMPNVRNLLATQGRVFTNCRTNVGWCQPSRAGFLLGLNSNRHGFTSGLTSPKFLSGDFPHHNTLGKWLQDAGYLTAMIGKYLNSAPETLTKGEDLAGWNTWRQFTGGGSGYHHANFSVNNGDGHPVLNTTDFQMDYLRDQTAGFINYVSANPKPWFCYLAPSDPHLPYAPAAEDMFAWTHTRWPIPPDFDAQELSYVPSWIAARDPVTGAHVARFQDQARNQLRELNALDRAIGALVNGAIQPELDNTVIIYTADNGLHLGDHRETGPSAKNSPYEAAMRIPLIIRGPGFPPGVSNENVTVPDITTTILEMAGAAAPANIDGVPVAQFQSTFADLRDVVDHPEQFTHRPLLHEITPRAVPTSTSVRPADGVTTTTVDASGNVVPDRKLFRYRDPVAGPDKYELYDLINDPDERRNKFKEKGLVAPPLVGTGDPYWQGELVRLEAILNDLLSA